PTRPEETNPADLSVTALFSEDLFYVADFTFYLTSDLFRGPTVLQIAVSDRFACFLFDFAHAFFGRAFNLIFCTRVHETLFAFDNRQSRLFLFVNEKSEFSR